MKVEEYFSNNSKSILQIVNNINTEYFDSHFFIRCFMINKERDYLKMASEYSSFRSYHSQIAIYLKKNCKSFYIEKIGEITSMNILQNESINALWRKTKIK